MMEESVRLPSRRDFAVRLCAVAATVCIALAMLGHAGSTMIWATDGTLEQIGEWLTEDPSTGPKHGPLYGNSSLFHTLAMVCPVGAAAFAVTGMLITNPARPTRRARLGWLCAISIALVVVACGLLSMHD